MHAIEVYESRISIGSGARRREVVSWEAWWVGLLDRDQGGKLQQLRFVSNKSREHAIEQLELLIAERTQTNS